MFRIEKQSLCPRILKLFFFKMFNVDTIEDLENYSLPYPFSALEPVIKAETVQQHYEGHMLVYINKLKILVEEFSVFKKLSLNDIILRSYGDFETTSIYYTASQIYAHILCWASLCPYEDSVKCVMSDKFLRMVEQSYNDINKFKEKFIEKALNLFGNGWIWLVVNENCELEIITTVNAFNPMNIDTVSQILMCVDLWEHAYYLQFLHKRKEYLESIFNIINWKYVSEKLLI